MEVTIFYAWQSDSDQKANKYLIRDAAVSACERISADKSHDWSVKLDSDTQGMAGMCDIPASILKKIAECDIFLCDLTLVGNTFNKSKKLPNSNVVFELGYAAKAIGFDSIVAVVNEHYGKMTEQVFDIKRRYAIPYSAEGKNDKAKDKLSKTLEKVFRLAINRCVVPKHKEKEKDRLVDMKIIQRETCKSISAIGPNEFHGFRSFPATVVTLLGSSPTPDDRDPFAIIKRFGHRPRMHHDSIVWNEQELQVFEFKNGQRLTQANGNDYLMFKQYAWPTQCELDSSLPKKTPDRISSISLQVNLVKNVHNLVKYMEEFGVGFPVMLGVSLVGIKGFRLIVGEHDLSDEFGSSDVHLDPLLIDEKAAQELLHDFANRMVPVVNQLCRQVGMLRSNCVGQNDIWTQRFF